MKRKLALDLDSLSVDSFDTSPEMRDGRGTVRGHDTEVEAEGPQPTPPVYDDDCTCLYSCLCKTAAYYCATVMYTAISCKYTQNLSCYYTYRCPTPPEEGG